MGKKNEARQAAKNDSKMTPEREAQLLAPWLIKELRCPCLVQILEERPDTDNPRKGIDHYFTMHYMGAAEYEFGALPQTLQRMRAALGDIKIMQMPLPDGRMFWYVGVEKSWGYARAYLEYCLDPSKRTVKTQMTGTSKNTSGPKYKLAGDKLTSHEVGWWVVRDADSDRGSELRATDWAMFDDDKHAKNFLAGLRN